MENSFFDTDIEQVEKSFGIERNHYDILDCDIGTYYVYLSDIEDETVSIMKRENGKELLIADSLPVKSAYLLVKELNELYKYRSL